MTYFVGLGVEHLDSCLRVYDSGYGIYDIQSFSFWVQDLGLGFCIHGFGCGAAYRGPAPFDACPYMSRIFTPRLTSTFLQGE